MACRVHIETPNKTHKELWPQTPDQYVYDGVPLMESIDQQKIIIIKSISPI